VYIVQKEQAVSNKVEELLDQWSMVLESGEKASIKNTRMVDY